MTSNDKRKISSLRDLPREITPPRDLWKGIEAQITAPPKITVEAPSHRLRYLATAAVIVALAVGVWIGRVMLPMPGAVTGAVTAGNVPVDEPGAFHAAYVMGPKYINQRAQLVRDPRPGWRSCRRNRGPRCCPVSRPSTIPSATWKESSARTRAMHYCRNCSSIPIRMRCEC